MIETNFSKLKKRIPQEKETIFPNISSTISNNLNSILENYSTNKALRFHPESKKNNLKPLSKEILMLNKPYNFFKLINKKLLTESAEFNVKCQSLKLEKSHFSEKSKQKFKSFTYFSLCHKNQVFTNFLEFMLHKFSLESNLESLPINQQHKTWTKMIESKNSRKLTSFSKQIKTKTGLANFEEVLFLAFVQSFTSQIYLKTSLKEQNFRKKVLLNLNNENANSPIEYSLNLYYFEIWKQSLYANFSKDLTKKQILETQLDSENFKFEILLNLFYIAKKFILPNQFQYDSNDLNLFNSDFAFSKSVVGKISKKSKFNFYRLKQFVNTFCSFYFLGFSSKICALNFHDFSSQSYFKKGFDKKFKNQFRFPRFIQNPEITLLTLKQKFGIHDSFLSNNLSLKPIFKINFSFFPKFVYVNLLNSKNASLLTSFHFIKQYYTAYVNFNLFSQNRLNNLNCAIKSLLINQNYLNSEKIVFEILQKLSLKNEKSAEISALNKNFLFYFSPVNEETYFVCSYTNLTNLEKYFLCLEVFNTWIAKNDFFNLKDLCSFVFNLVLIYKPSVDSTFKNQLFLDLKKFSNVYSLKETLFNQNLIQGILKLSSIDETLTSIKKLNYVKKVKQIIKINSSQTQENLIYKLTPYILSWCYLYRFSLKKSDWNELDKVLSQFIWRWSCRRHNNKSKKWIQSKYFFTLNKELWFFGQIVKEPFAGSVKTKNNLNFVYLPFHGQIYDFLSSRS